MNLFGVLVLVILIVVGFAVFCVACNWRIKLTGFVVFTIAVIISGVFLGQANRWDRNFAKIHIGDNREQVRQIMGRPTEATDATIGIYGSKRLATDRILGCKEQYWYYPFFTPECWWIAFDEHERVLKT